jgi:hypothetical protein
MKNFNTCSLIPCYNESKAERCINCSLLHAVKSLPNGIETTLTNLISKVLEPAAEAYGKPIQVVKGFRCPNYFNRLNLPRQNPYVRGEAVDITVPELVEGPLSEELQKLYSILQSLGTCTELVLHDTYIHVIYTK